MSSRMWRTLILGLGALVVAVTTGTAVMAAMNDQDDPPATRQARDESAGDSATVAAVCVEGVPDCEDMIVEGGGAAGACLVGATECNDTPGFAQCATDEPCGDFDARCAADTVCVEPWLMEAPVCPEGMAYEECFPDGAPPGWDCLQLESFPVQVRCYPVGCTPADGPISILPLPGEDLPLEVEPQIDPADPSLVDPGVAVGEPVPMPAPIECLPPECEVLDDGSIACKTQPPVECGPTETCIAPDCAVSSDGSVFCPDPAPFPCDEIQGDDGGCSSHGGCGELGCGGEGFACPDGVTDEECAKLIEEERRDSGGGSGGSSGSTEALE